MPPTPRSLLDRFWAKVDDSAGASGCWPWRGAVSRSGRGSTPYGYIQTGRRGSPLVRAHRFALVLVTGEDPQDLEACHAPRCTTSLCCNAPHGHLRWGTRLENEQDKRHRRTDAEVIAAVIAQLEAEGLIDVAGDLKEPEGSVRVHAGR